MTGLAGRTLGRYEIIDLLAAGGMGEVYRARDSRLGRMVAVKVISERSTGNPRSIERFKREAETVAQLSHPNILEIHDFGQEGDTLFAVAELLEGNDLRSRLRGSRLPLSKALEIGIAVAQGLAAAHSKDIVHRDIKPENIFITATGQVKILDFGIAGLRESAPPEPTEPTTPTLTQTATGHVLGTPGYMAPEQLRGEKADVRSDIFSLGCLLYEMLTGRRAFRGESSHAVMLAILNADPDPISGCRSDVPPALEAVINRCLEKEPGERFDSARDVAFALQAVSTGRDSAAGPPPRRSVSSRSMWLKTAAAGLSLVALGSLAWLGARLLGAPPPLPDRLILGVVPFDAAGGDATLRAFAVGLSENLSDDLALIAQQDRGIAWVVPAGEARSVGAATATALGRSFGVTIAVTGEVDRVGQKVRLALALVDPKSGNRLRAVTIEDAPGNLGAFQNGPAVRVAQQLGVLVTPESSARLQASATTTASSFDFFTRGRGVLALAGGREDLTAALALLDQAVADDRLFADAWVLRAASRVALFHATGEEGLIQLGLEDAARARELDGRPEDSWRATAALHLAAGRPAEAAAALEEGVRLAPADADLRLELAEAYRSAGRWTDAEAELKRAIYLRPDYWVGYDRLAKLYLGRGMLEAAAVEFGHVVDCAPEFALGWVKLGGTNLLLERPEVARELLERSLEIEPTAAALSNLGSIHFDASRFGKAAEMYAAAVELDPDNYMMWGNLGYACRFGVEPEKGEAAFRRAAELGRARLAETPDDTDLATDVAGYHAMLGETQAGLELLDAVAATVPGSPLLISKIAETYSDLGERDQALEWVDRAFAAGEPRSRFEDRPTMSRLIADERYQALVEKYFGAR